MLPILLRGIVIGFSIAAPVGPIGVLCIRRSLAEGRLAGLVSGLGAATADAIYGSIAGFGLTFISVFLINQTILLRMIGGAFLLYLGVKTFVAKPAHLEYGVEEGAEKASMKKNYVSTFLLTLTNPLTILSFTAIFAGLGLGVSEPGNIVYAGALVTGVFLGSAAWWFLLSWFASLFRNKLNTTSLLWLNRLSGSIIILFGVLAFVSLFTMLTL